MRSLSTRCRDLGLADGWIQSAEGGKGKITDLRIHWPRPTETPFMKQLSSMRGGVGAILASAVALSTAGCSLVGIRTTEEPAYRVLEKDGAFELREYDSYVVVETVVDADFDQAGRTSFRRLFGYISGDNAAQDEFAMTAPVLADGSSRERGEKMAMTAPVFGGEERDGWRYAFVLPAGTSREVAPSPTDPEVTLHTVPSTRVAVMRFSGFTSESKLSENIAELETWMAAQGLVATSSPRWAGYDPPWTLPFLRRNEVWMDVE